MVYAVVSGVFPANPLDRHDRPGHPGVKINGQVRYRMHADDKDFGKTGLQLYSELRSRIGITVAPQENLDLFVQLQDSRLIGSNSGGLNADANVGLHQGYFKYVIGRGWSAQAGRFEMSYGNQRLVGAVGWHNVGRTWDGVRINKDSEKWYLDCLARSSTKPPLPIFTRTKTASLAA